MIHSVLASLCGLLLAACQFEFSTDFNTGKKTRTPEELASLIEADFTPQAGGATLRVLCPGGLTGEVDRTFLCTGSTSDGYVLDIEILERGGGAFRWLVVKSARAPGGQPITRAQAEDSPEAMPEELPAEELLTSETVDDTGRRCVTIDTGYVCLEQ